MLADQQRIKRNLAACKDQNKLDKKPIYIHSISNDQISLDDKGERWAAEQLHQYSTSSVLYANNNCYHYDILNQDTQNDSTPASIPEMFQNIFDGAFIIEKQSSPAPHYHA